MGTEPNSGVPDEVLANLRRRVLAHPLALAISGRVRDSGGEGLFQNALSLFCVQFFRKFLPLITIPYLARVLGPEGWGLVATFQSLALTMVLLIEFGFPFSATRRVARCKHSLENLSDIWAGVLGAQTLIAAAAIALTGFLSLFVPLLRNNLSLTVWAVVWAIAEGMNPAWYFLGVERMHFIAALEIGSKVVMTCCLIALVHSAQDTYRVLAIQAIAPIASLAVAMWIIHRDVPLRTPTPLLVKDAMIGSLSLFMMRSAESLYTLANGFLLGMLAGPGVVGYFAGPEKISRAMIGVFNPVRETLYPRLSKLIHSSPNQAARLARAGMAINGLGGITVGLCVFFFAPYLVRLVLGPEFQPAVRVLRILAILPPLISITQSVGMGWLLPLGRDRVITRSMALGALVNLTLAVILVPKFAHVGIAWAVVCAEAFVCATVVYSALHDPERRFPILSPLHSGADRSVEEAEAKAPVTAEPASSLMENSK